MDNVGLVCQVGHELAVILAGGLWGGGGGEVASGGLSLEPGKFVFKGNHAAEEDVEVVCGGDRQQTGGHAGEFNDEQIALYEPGVELAGGDGALLTGG